jgi:hypothetical protein
MHKSEPLKIKTKTTDSKISAAAPVITVSITKNHTCLLECGQKQRNYDDYSCLSAHPSIPIKKEVSSNAKLLRDGYKIL